MRAADGRRYPPACWSRRRVESSAAAERRQAIWRARRLRLSLILWLAVRLEREVRWVVCRRHAGTTNGASTHPESSPWTDSPAEQIKSRAVQTWADGAQSNRRSSSSIRPPLHKRETANISSQGQRDKPRFIEEQSWTWQYPADRPNSSTLYRQIFRMGKKSDPLHITQTEHSGVLGRHSASSGTGATVAAASAAQYQGHVPFDCCAITLQPWKHPVADPTDGTVYELTNIVPWLKKHGISPASAQELNPEDLLSLHFAQKNEESSLARDGNQVWHDPVSFKTFNHSTHLVAIRTTGNVYAFDTVQNLNIKPKYWADLLTGEPFERNDIITLQDPNNVSRKQIADLHHVKERMKLTAEDRGEKQDTDEVNISATGSAATLLTKLRQQVVTAEEAKAEAARTADRKMEEAAAASAATTVASTSRADPSSTIANAATSKHGRSTGMTAASFTSTGLTPRTQSEREILSQEDAMYDAIRKGSKGKGPIKGYVRLVTNFGPLNLELHCDKAPKTCYNFLTLCHRDTYTGTIFHRNIPGFMVQGGDPSGTGRGGESMWGKPFSDELSAPGAFRHEERGCVSMANRGPDTNGSQFFITYAAKRNLDKKHTVFGHLIDSPSSTLDSIERVPTDPATDKPLRTVRILDVQIFSDPFADFQEREQRKASRNEESKVAEREEKRRKKEADRTTWLGTHLGDKQPSDLTEHGVTRHLAPKKPSLAPASSTAAVGRYLMESATGRVKKARNNGGDAASESDIGDRKRKVAAPFSHFGDFSGW